MKSFSEIKDNFRIKVAAEGEKGFNADITMPPSVLVGVREGQSLREIDDEITAAFELAGETR